MRNGMLSSPMILKASHLVQATCALLKAAGRELNPQPHLVVLIVGEHEPSWIYVRQKQKIAQELGIRVTLQALPSEINQQDLNALCATYSADSSYHAILVQLPLPLAISTQEVVSYIDPLKDVDGLTLENQGALLMGLKSQRFIPCTPLGIMRLLRFYGIVLSSMRVLVIGRSTLVGKPIALCALEENATVTIAHSKTRNLKTLAQQHDVIISATGIPSLLNWSDCLPHQVIVDVGIHRNTAGTLCGDFGPLNQAPSVKAYTPVPGGVGPMTINTLMYNVFMAYAHQTDTSWSLLQSQIDALTYSASLP